MIHLDAERLARDFLNPRRIPMAAARRSRGTAAWNSRAAARGPNP